MKNDEMKNAIHGHCLPPAGSGSLIGDLGLGRPPGERKVQTLIEASLMASGYIAAKCGPMDPVLMGLVMALDDLGVECDYTRELAKLEKGRRKLQDGPGRPGL